MWFKVYNIPIVGDNNEDWHSMMTFSDEIQAEQSASSKCPTINRLAFLLISAQYLFAILVASCIVMVIQLFLQR